MTGELPLHRFSEFAALTPAEIDKVGRLGDRPQHFGRSAVIRSQGADPSSIFLLLEGWVASSITLADGSTQIVKIHLPGDVMGAPSLSMLRAVETLTTLTTALVSTVPVKRFGSLLAQSPRFAGLMFLSAQRERVALMDALTWMGSSSAVQRLASMLLDFLERLSLAGKVEEAAFELPLTQEQIGDILGISPVHVNRMIQKLETGGLIGRTQRWVRILDRQGLERFAGWSRRQLATNIDWMAAGAHG